ncbi:hypothetical protein HK100_005595 [Physocladia obscura]|uniref:Uncharacterized protein n=1 Tax=Physocladia obscura TaxID=109957 RepID=A0AAD5T6G5_9FUNG|nr:hypothetical protein HK100_005595 [Physocladia obscura]
MSLPASSATSGFVVRAHLNNTSSIFTVSNVIEILSPTTGESPTRKDQSFHSPGNLQISAIACVPGSNDAIVSGTFVGDYLSLPKQSSEKSIVLHGNDLTVVAFIARLAETGGFIWGTSFPVYSSSSFSYYMNSTNEATETSKSERKDSHDDIKTLANLNTLLPVKLTFDAHGNIVVAGTFFGSLNIGLNVSLERIPSGTVKSLGILSGSSTRSNIDISNFNGYSQIMGGLKVLPVGEIIGSDNKTTCGYFESSISLRKKLEKSEFVSNESEYISRVNFVTDLSNSGSTNAGVTLPAFISDFSVKIASIASNSPDFIHISSSINDEKSVSEILKGIQFEGEGPFNYLISLASQSEIPFAISIIPPPPEFANFKKKNLQISGPVQIRAISQSNLFAYSNLDSLAKQRQPNSGVWIGILDLTKMTTYAEGFIRLPEIGSAPTKSTNSIVLESSSITTQVPAAAETATSPGLKSLLTSESQVSSEAKNEELIDFPHAAENVPVPGDTKIDIPVEPVEKIVDEEAVDVQPEEEGEEVVQESIEENDLFFIGVEYYLSIRAAVTSSGDNEPRTSSFINRIMTNLFNPGASINRGHYQMTALKDEDDESLIASSSSQNHVVSIPKFGNNIFASVQRRASRDVQSSENSIVHQNETDAVEMAAVGAPDGWEWNEEW